MKKLLISDAIIIVVATIIVAVASILTKGMENNARIALIAVVIVFVSVITIMVTDRRSSGGSMNVYGFATASGAMIVFAVISAGDAVVFAVVGIIIGVLVASAAAIVITDIEENIKKMIVVIYTLAAVALNSAIIYFIPQII